MKKLLIVVLAAAWLAVPSVAEHDDGRLSAEERAELVELLESSRQRLEALAARAEGERWSTKPAPDSWSVGEVVEHVVLAEEGISGMAQGALAGTEDPEWQTIAGREIDEMVAGLQDRSQKFQSPEMFVPKGEMSRDEVLKRFGAARALTLDFVHRTEAPLKKYTAEGPAGKMNAHQWMALVAAHNMRHNLQIAEVLETLAASPADDQEAAE